MNPWSLTPAQRLILSQNITPLWAEEVLRDRGGSLTGDQLRAVLLCKGESEAEAQRQAARRELEMARAEAQGSARGG